MMVKTVTPGEAARMMEVGATTVRKWIRDGTLTAQRIGKKHRRIGRDVLLEFASRHGMPDNILERIKG